MVLKAVRWETEKVGRLILNESVIQNGRVLRRDSLRLKKQKERNGIRFVALLSTDFDAYDGYSGYVCPSCGGTERTSCCECAACGMKRMTESVW